MARWLSQCLWASGVSFVSGSVLEISGYAFLGIVVQKSSAVIENTILPDHHSVHITNVSFSERVHLNCIHDIVVTL